MQKCVHENVITYQKPLKKIHNNEVTCTGRILVFLHKTNLL